MIRRAVAALLLLAALAQPAAAGDPTLEWRTLETPHFRITFYRGEDRVAYKLADIAERVHAILVPRLGWEPRAPTQIVLVDQTDGANGFADVTPYNLVRLFLAAPGDQSTLGDYDDWLWTLFMHEYTHVLHIDNITGIPALSHYLVGKRWAPNQVQPRWFTEGLAVLEESRRTSAGRIRSRFFEMQLRVAVLEGAFEQLDGMSSGTWRYPHGNTAYLYGAYFMDFIARRHGEEGFSEVSRRYGRNPIPFSLNRTARGVFGETYQQLYDAWLAELRESYGRQSDAVRARGETHSVPLTTLGEFQGHAQFDPKTPDRVLFVAADGYRQAALRAVPLGGGKAETLFEFPGAGGPFQVTPDGQEVVYSETETCRPGASSYDELFAWNLRTGERRPLTDCLRAREPALSPDGHWIAFAATATGQATSHLGLIRRDKGAASGVHWIVRSNPGEQVISPTFAPDGRTIAYSAWTAGGYRDLFLVEVGGGPPRRLWKDRATDTDPRYSDDGKYLFFSSDRTGTFNVFAFEVATGRILQVTNVLDGAFQPIPSRDGRWLAFQRYSARGFDVHSMPLDPAGWREAPEYVDNHPPPDPALLTLGEHAPVLRERGYRFWETLRPRALSLNTQPGSFGQNILVTTDALDAAALHAATLALEIGTSRGEINEFFAYSYYGFRPTLTADFQHFTLKRGGLVIDGHGVTYAESNTLGSAVYQWPLVAKNDRSSSLVVDYTIQRFTGDNVHVPPDPNTRVPVLPEQGNLAGVGLSWAYDDAREYTWTEGLVRGRRVGLSLRLQYPELGGDYRVNRITWRWYENLGLPVESRVWKRHSITVGYEGGISDGNTRRRGVFVLGGFSGDTGDPIRGLFDPAFRIGDATLRGYPSGALAGEQYHLVHVEYRLPVWIIERALSRDTSPIYFQRLSAKLFSDWGSAFNGDVDLDKFRHGIGGELGLLMRLWYNTDVTATVGMAYGLDQAGDRQTYFALKSAL